MPRILDHTHGTTAHCDHPDCKAATARYIKRWNYDRTHGRPHRIPTPPQLLAHLDTLRGAGWSYRAIAAEADLTTHVVHRLHTQRPATTRPTYATAILALDPDRIPARPAIDTTEPFVPRIGTTRRLQALLTIGWGHQQMRAHCGLNTANLLHQQGRWVTRTTHDRVAAMYQTLKHRPGPSSNARTWATKLGYTTPAQWLDIDHDQAPLTLMRPGPAPMPRPGIRTAAQILHDLEQNPWS